MIEPAIIESVISVFDRLIQLLKVRREERYKYFDSVIEPLYRTTELIVKDYVSLFRELVHKLSTEEDVASVIKWLEERRLELLPVRIQMRSNLRNSPGRLELSATRENEDLLVKGIWGILKGGVSLVEEGHAKLGEYGHGDHTVLDLLYIWSSDPIALNRSRYIANAKAQLDCIEKAWSDASDGYFAYRNYLTMKVSKRYT